MLVCTDPLLRFARSRCTG